MATIEIEMEDEDMKELLELKQASRKGMRNAKTMMRIVEIECSILNKTIASYFYERGEET